MSKTVVYRLKPEFKGKIIRRQIPRMGEMEFNTNNVKPSEFGTYAACGFADLFEAEEVKPAPRAERVAAKPAAEIEENDAEDMDDMDEDGENDDLDLGLEKDEEEELATEEKEEPAAEIEEPETVKEEAKTEEPAAEPAAEPTKPKNKGGRPPKKK